MTIEMGLAQAIDAEAFGQPGQRTFRLRIVGASSESASMWMEKEQFQALSLAIGQVLSELRYAPPSQEPPFYEFPEIADHDFKVGRMAIGLDPADQTLVLYLSDVQDDDEENPTLKARLTQDLCAALRGQLEEIVSRGRPVCPLCHVVMDEAGHACIRGNGHSMQPIPDEDADETGDP